MTNQATTERPEIDLPDFDPEKFKQLSDSREPNFIWKPGDQVTIEVPPIPVRDRMIYSLGWGAAISFGLRIILDLSGLVNGSIFGVEFEWWSVTAAILLVSVLGCWMVIGLRHCGRTTHINWHTDTVKIKVGNRTITGSMKDVDSVIVRGRRHEKPPRYECDVMLEIRKERVQIIRTWRDSNKKRVYRHAASLANELARALSVEWKWMSLDYTDKEGLPH